MKTESQRFKTVKEFGVALGLSEIQIEMIRQKKKLIQHLKKMRIKKGLSQVEVAHLLGSKQPAIARMEAGQVSQVSMDFLLKAALVLRMPVTIRPTKLFLELRTI